MRSCSRFVREERGDMLPFALVALMVAALLMAPLLAHISSGHRTVDEGREVMRRHYASDAGVEYALHVLQSDADLRQQLRAEEKPVITLDAPTTVNDETPVVEIIYAGQMAVGQSEASMVPLDWVLWADSLDANHTIQTTGSGHTIYGDVHSNHIIFISGSGHVIHGDVSYVTSFSGGGVSIVPGPAEQVEVLSRPISWTLAHFAPDGDIALAAAAEGMYYHHESWPYDGAGAVVPEGLHYVTGPVSMQGSSIIRPNVTIVATEDITLSGSNVEYTPYITNTAPLVFFSAHQDINLSGSNVRIRGVSYAPQGEISLTGSGGVIQGAFIGGVVKVAGSGAQIELESILVPDHDADPATNFAQLYDVRSTAGGTVTTARLRHDVDGSWRILSWDIE
jgi:hypothetical protein